MKSTNDRSPAKTYWPSSKCRFFFLLLLFSFLCANLCFSAFWKTWIEVDPSCLPHLSEGQSRYPSSTQLCRFRELLGDVTHHIRDHQPPRYLDHFSLSRTNLLQGCFNFFCPWALFRFYSQTCLVWFCLTKIKRVEVMYLLMLTVLSFSQRPKSRSGTSRASSNQGQATASLPSVCSMMDRCGQSHDLVQCYFRDYGRHWRKCHCGAVLVKAPLSWEEGLYWVFLFVFLFVCFFFCAVSPWTCLLSGAAALLI